MLFYLYETRAACIEIYYGPNLRAWVSGGLGRPGETHIKTVDFLTHTVQK